MIPDGIRWDIYARELNPRIEAGYRESANALENTLKRASACSKDFRLQKGRNDPHDQINLVTFLLEHN